MRKFIKGLTVWAVLSLCVFAVSSCNDLYAADTWSSNKNSTYTDGQVYRKHIASKQVETQAKAEAAYPVPEVYNFMERKTIYEWTKRWDVPNKPCYVYVFIGDNCIGYFISNGKPASTKSYLLPESYDLFDVSTSSTHMEKQAMDIDGTYGDNNPGWRMFLASGQAVEFSGYNTSCLYSDSPIPVLSTRLLAE